MRKPKRARHAPRAPTTPTTPKTGSASRQAALREELRTWCVDRRIGPDAIDPKELQAWCIQHKVEPTEARRLIEIAARHGGRWICSGCEHCTRADAAAATATASPSDDVRDVRDAWAKRFPPLGRLPSIADADLEAAIADQDRAINMLRREVEFAHRASGARHVSAPYDMLRYADPNVLPEAFDHIARLREEHHEDERMMFVERLAEELKGADPHIIKLVERVESAGVAGEIKPAASEITLRAVRDYPPLDLPWDQNIDGPPEREFQGPSWFAPHQREEKRPMSLWSALALDPPTPPEAREIDALKTRAQALHAEHNRVVAAVDVLNRNAAEDNAHRALQLRLDAATACREWLEARRLAKADEVRQRRERLMILATRLRVRPRGRWTFSKLAQLILASTDDWTKPPCPAYVAEWKRVEPDARRRERKVAESIRIDLMRAEWKPDRNL